MTPTIVAAGFIVVVAIIWTMVAIGRSAPPEIEVVGRPPVTSTLVPMPREIASVVSEVEAGTVTIAHIDKGVFAANVRDHTVRIDTTGVSGPTPAEVLAASVAASCSATIGGNFSWLHPPTVRCHIFDRPAPIGKPHVTLEILLPREIDGATAREIERAAFGSAAIVHIKRMADLGVSMRVPELPRDDAPHPPLTVP